MDICNICGKPIDNGQKMHRNQSAHTYCIQMQPYDVTIKSGNCTMEFHSQLMTKKQLQAVFHKFKF